MSAVVLFVDEMDYPFEGNKTEMVNCWFWG